MKNKMPEASEHQIQTAISNYLQMKNWYVMRLNAGKYSAGEGRAKRFIVGQKAGTPDLMAFKKGDTYTARYEGKINLIFLEVKRPGKKATPLQVAVMDELETYGAQCYVVTSVEDVQAVGI